MCMMTRKRCALVLMLASCAGVFGFWMLNPRTAITRENVARIKEGMTLAEIEAILGGPARKEAAGPLVPDLILDGDTKSNRETAERFGYAVTDLMSSPRYLIWQSSESMIAVSFVKKVDDKGRITEYGENATHLHWFAMRRADESPLDVMRRWLRL